MPSLGRYVFPLFDVLPPGHEVNPIPKGNLAYTYSYYHVLSRGFLVMSWDVCERSTPNLLLHIVGLHNKIIITTANNNNSKRQKNEPVEMLHTLYAQHSPPHTFHRRHISARSRARADGGSDH